QRRSRSAQSAAGASSPAKSTGAPGTAVSPDPRTALPNGLSATPAAPLRSAASIGAVGSLVGALRRLLVRVQVAIFTAAGVTLLVGGLLTYDATAGTLPTPNPSATPTQAASPTPLPTVAPGLSTPSPTPVPTGKASRILIPALDIDLPVVQAPQGFPYCNVAQYVKEFSQPGLPGATVIGAHARKGMFGPIHDAARVNNGASMIGMLVLVYT